MSQDDQDSGAPPSAESHDLALIHGVTPEGDLAILRKRGERVELGGVRPLRHGVPITGEVVRLLPRKEFPLLCDVVTELPAKPAPSDVAPPRSADRSGPPQVATERYRENWERTFSRTRNLAN
ncbi:MAG TPA: hypothetical protein VKY73_05045 [Polyangiaceae bacterium]|nr:hypothetical protein [Polyangiaceae bacterium]